MSQEAFVDKLVADKNKQSVRKANAKKFFDELIKSLTKGKRVWTPSERMQFNRVATFLAS